MVRGEGGRAKKVKITDRFYQSAEKDEKKKRRRDRQECERRGEREVKRRAAG